MMGVYGNVLPGFFYKRQTLDSSKLIELTDGNSKLDKNGREFSKRVENTVGKGEIAPECFQKTCTADT